jgi:hypothetical protein
MLLIYEAFLGLRLGAMYKGHLLYFMEIHIDAMYKRIKNDPSTEPYVQSIYRRTV